MQRVAARFIQSLPGPSSAPTPAPALKRTTSRPFSQASAPRLTKNRPLTEPPILYKRRTRRLRNMDASTWTDEEFVARRAEIEQRLARVSELEAKLALQNASYNPFSTTTTTAAAAAAATADTPAADVAAQSLPAADTPSAGGVPAKPSYKKPRGPPKAFDPSKYTTRLIALKFAYLGSRYNGYEHHANNTTPLPTIEEEMWKALKKTRLILPTPKPGIREDEVNWEGCDYSKCGRTDRGVSAFGQVIGVRVRSNRPKPKARKPHREDVDSGEVGAVASEAAEARADGLEGEDVTLPGEAEEEEKEVPFDDIKDEIPYMRLLNRVLPEDIRVLAWCPNPGDDFSARFNCRERRYKYFFTNPGFGPMPGTVGLYPGTNGRTMREGWLDIGAMQEAASYLVGLHDFRNFCKVDASKQITNYQRRITHASIDRWNTGSGFASYTRDAHFQIPRLESSADKESIVGTSDLNGPGLFTFTVHGSAFLWHQVRHLVAILFLVGQGLESPTVVKELLDIEKNPTKPKYDMATDMPLVLWDCVFPAEGDEKREDLQDSLNWVWIADERSFGGSTNVALEEKFGHGGAMTDIWRVWHKRRIDEALAGSLLDLVASQGPNFSKEDQSTPVRRRGRRSDRAYDGGDEPRLQGIYLPVLKKERMETVEVINARYLARKGLDKKDLPMWDDDENE